MYVRRLSRGFTLLEVMTATALLALVVTGAEAMLSNTTQSTRDSFLTTMVTNELQSQVDRVKGAPYANLFTEWPAQDPVTLTSGIYVLPVRDFSDSQHGIVLSTETATVQYFVYNYSASPPDSVAYTGTKGTNPPPAIMPNIIEAVITLTWTERVGGANSQSAIAANRTRTRTATAVTLVSGL
jgi:prepilin-type N-terminal cleavage/methylation domain-containing protein